MKGILFNCDMVRAIQDGRKTVTRRVVKPQPNIELATVSPTYYSPIEILNYVNFSDKNQENCKTYYPKYNKGDILYVRETWCEVPYECEHIPIKDGHISIPKIAYKADSVIDYLGMWKPSIHMPKSAARIFLKVSDVRVERLQDMKDIDAYKEGITDCKGNKCKGYELCDALSNHVKKCFSYLWNSTIKKQDLDKYGWNSNPWVWVYEFERINNNENNNN